MNELEYKKFIKRYDKFKKNNLPTPFWDEERQTLEYIYFYNRKSILNSKEVKDELEVNSRLSEALGDIAFTGFYYSFTYKHIMGWKENGKYIKKSVVGHSHAHSFEEVVSALYSSPESFNIAKDEEQFYSKQELEYLRRVQKYLLFIGMKDLEKQKVPVSRYRNKIHSKYENAVIYRFDDEVLKNILTGKRNFRAIDWYPEYTRNERKYKPKEFQALIVDKEDNFRMFVEFTYEEIKFYKDIKNVYIRDDLKDDDKVIVNYFKILEIFNHK
jgi:hypothetical protein